MFSSSNGAEVLQSTNPVRSCWSSKRFVSIREHSWRRSNYTDLEQKIINRPKCLANCSKNGVHVSENLESAPTKNHLEWRVFHSLRSFIHPKWLFGISSINSTTMNKGFEATKSFSISVCCIIHSHSQFLGEKNVLFHPLASMLHW